MSTDLHFHKQAVVKKNKTKTLCLLVFKKQKLPLMECLLYVQHGAEHLACV